MSLLDLSELLKARAEIERLEADLTTAEFDRLSNEAEIARLRAALEEISRVDALSAEAALAHTALQPKEGGK